MYIVCVTHGMHEIVWSFITAAYYYHNDGFICRARLIPFTHPLQYNLQSINEASPAAGPSLIRIGHYLANIEPKVLENVQQHVQTLVPLLDSCGVIEYTILVASALLVSMTSVCVPECVYVCGWVGSKTGCN